MIVKSFENYSDDNSEYSKISLIKFRYKIRDAILDSNLTEEDLRPQGKCAAISFIENGWPSEWYLEGLLDKLKESGYDISKIFWK